MAMGRQGDCQGDLVVAWSEMPRSPGHVFYDRLQEVLIGGGFDGYVEAICAPYYAQRNGAPSVPPGRYFRMHMVGYFEGIDSERGIEWRCSDSLSLRAFLRLETSERVPDHSWLSRTRGRLPHEVHDRVFGWVLSLLAEHGLVRGARIGVDASTMEANAALRHIVRRDTGEDYRAMLTRMARESGIETPSAEDLVRLDRKRKGRKLSNQAWVSETDPQARVARMKNGTTHLAYKPEHAVDRRQIDQHDCDAEEQQYLLARYQERPPEPRQRVRVAGHPQQPEDAQEAHDAEHLEAGYREEQRQDGQQVRDAIEA